MSNDLIVRLRAALDEREAIALATATAYGDTWTVRDDDWVCGSNGADVIAEPHTPAVYIAQHDPKFVLVDIAAKRKLIERGGPFCNSRCDEPGHEPMDPATDWTTPLEHHFDCAALEAAKAVAEAYGIQAEGPAA